MHRFLFGLVLLLSTTLGLAQPQFAGLEQALPAPRAALLHWERAKGQGKIVYRIYQQGAGDRPVAEVEGTDHVLLNLAPGVPQVFVVRAADEQGREDSNTAALTVTPLADEPAAEFRAVWISRFDWAGGTTQKMRDRLTTMMTSLGRGNFNAVVFQVRGQGDTLYPSPTEPWSPLIPAGSRDEDYCLLAAREARRNGLQFHAWVNLSVIWQKTRVQEYPTDQNHPFYRFANPTDPSRQLGVVHDTQGKPKLFGGSDYTWLTPGNPEVEAYVRAMVMEAVTRFEPDGLHWDDRTGLPGGASNDPVSLQRFAGRGNPTGIKDLKTWQMDQLQRLLANIYVQAAAARPGMLISFSPFGIQDRNRVPGYGRFSDGLRDFGTNAEAWLAAGVLDALIPQIYWREGDPDPNYATLLRDWMIHNKSGRPIWPGSSLRRGEEKQEINPWQASYVATARALGANGTCMFSYQLAPDADWAGCSSTFYRTRVPVPIPPHLGQPTTGNLAFVVRDAAGQAVVDAHIRISTLPNAIFLSSADGFVGIPGVPAGVAGVIIEGPAAGQRIEVSGPVEPGRTAWTEMRFP